MSSDSLSVAGEFFKGLEDTRDRINHATFLIHEIERTGDLSRENSETMLFLRNWIKAEDNGFMDQGHRDQVSQLERRLATMGDKEIHARYRAFVRAERDANPAAEEPTSSAPSTKSNDTPVASKMAKGLAVGGVVVSGVDTAFKVMTAIEDPNVVNTTKVIPSTVRTVAAVRNCNKVFTKGVASTTARKLCGGAAVIGAGIDIYENIVDPDMDTPAKIIASSIDVASSVLCFCGPIGLVAGVGLGLASSWWIKPALRNESKKSN
jgi:hypothetical protein